FVVISFFISILLKIDKFYFTVKFTSHQLYHLCIETLVDRYHNTQAHTFTNHLGEWHIEQGCQFGNRDKLSHLQYAAIVLCFCCSTFFGHFFALASSIF